MFIMSPSYFLFVFNGRMIIRLYDYSVTSPLTGMTFTYERSSLFLWNSTMPSVKANKVWSLPIPTLSPG